MDSVITDFFLDNILLPHLFPDGMITDKTLGERAVFLPSSWSVNGSIPFRFNPKLDVLIQIHKRSHLVAFYFRADKIYS